MFKGIKVNNLLSYKKVLLILLFAMFFIPKNVFAYTITFDANGAKYEDNTTTNVVSYDNNHNIVSGTYKEPVNYNLDSNLVGEISGVYWVKNISDQEAVDLSKINSDITLYAKAKEFIINIDYSGNEQQFIVPFEGRYYLKTWGASGGSGKNTCSGSCNNIIKGGYGGFSIGKIVSLNTNDILYINVGGSGTDIFDTTANSGLITPGGYNGGGSSKTYSSGGGATHISTISGLLSSLENNKDSILIVSGGGSGASASTPGSGYCSGGSGGGYIGDIGHAGAFGNGGAGATQTSGFAFGQGANNTGAGGGFYGGFDGAASNSWNSCGGAGSGYIGNSLLKDKYMTCYNCTESDQVETRTIKNTCSSSDPEDDCSKVGNGYAKVVYKPVEVTYVLENESYKYYITNPNQLVEEKNAETKIGYSFKWTNSGQDFDITQQIENDITITGVYTPITYNISYNITGGTVSGNPETYTVEDLPISLNNPTPTEPGYIFTGWTGTGLSEKTMNVTIPVNSTGDREYTAHFEKEKYTITYNLNGGELETGVTNPEEYYVDTPDITLNNPTREGYTFIGWTGSNGTTPTNVIIATGSTGNKTYTANYQIDSHTATFDSNLGSTAIPLTITKDYNQELGSLPTTSRGGYIFDGWFTGKEDGSQISATTKMPAYNPTYYAHWTPITYTIHFNNNSGTGTMSDETMTYGVSKALDENTFTRDGYTFAGWNTKADGTGTNYIDKQEIFNLTDIDGAEFTLYAKWAKNEYIINYDVDGGQLENPKTTYSVDDEEFTLVKPTKVGYDFVGWTGTGVSTPTKNVVIPTGSTGTRNYTAHWTETIYTIEYIRNYDNATVTVAGNPTSYKITDSDITLNNPGDPDTYHFFTGWATDLDTESDLSTTFVIPSGTTGSLKIYAVFQTSPYTVTFDSDGGNNIDPISKLGTEDIGSLPIPVKAGYTFKGWFVNDKLIDQTFHSRVDVTAIAKWEKNPDPAKPIIINPTTGDNVMTYIMMLIISVIGLGYTGYKFKLKTKKTQ